MKPPPVRASSRPRLTQRNVVHLVVSGAILGVLLLDGCTDDTPTAPGGADLANVAGMGLNADGTRIVVEPHWLTLDTIGVTGTFSATVIDAAGDTVDAEVTWGSADTAIATVDTAGVVTTVAFGRTKVSATYDSATVEATVEVALPLTDREILEIFYEATGGDDWTDNTNWLSDADLDEWYGVRAHQGKVSNIFLRENNLVGAIPPELGGLEKLFALSLDENRLSGPIPPELSKFNGLRDLFLGRNPGISGRIPAELGYMQRLEYLGLDQTNLTGPVPLTFANLDLTRFYFDKDGPCIPADLQSWVDSIPQAERDYAICTDKIVIDPPSLYIEAHSLGDTVRLTAAVISAEGDTVPDAAITWSSADTTVATVDSTGLVTTVAYKTTEITAASDSLQARSQVEIVFKFSNRQVLDTLFRVTGGENWTDTTNWLSDKPLSEWFGVETNDSGTVVGLSLDNNNLTGEIPRLLGKLDDLVTLDLGGNALAGKIPWQLRELHQLRDLVLNGNALEGPLTREVGYMGGLRYLHIGDNNFTGVVPGSFADLELDTLYAAGSGVCVPPSLGDWFDGIEQTDSATRCVASMTIEIIELPSPFYSVGEMGELSATYVSAERDTVPDAPIIWRSGDTAVATADASGMVTAVGTGTTEVTAAHDSTTASIEVVVDLPENDRDVLEILHDRARGTGWTDGTNWGTDEPLSAWSGIETDDSGRVVRLSLPDNNLRGTLHSSIGLLDQLVTLDLSRNWVAGPLPAELGDLSLLRDLALGVNGFSGTLPWQLGQLDSLRNLNLAATSLTGLVPAQFAGLELESFLVGGTTLCLPPSLAAWHDSISDADDAPECAGRVSIEPSSLTFGAVGDTVRLSATVVDAEGRAVESPVVTWESADPVVATVDTAGLVTARSSGVTNLTATYDSVTAGVAEAAVRLPGSDRIALEVFYHAMGGEDWKDNTNWLSDEPLGEWYGVDVNRSGRVRYLELQDNNLHGRIPAAVGLLDTLFSFALRDTAVTGPIPPAIGRLRHLRDLRLGGTRVDGPLPPEMGNMTGLDYVVLSGTRLSGPLPETLANLDVGRFYFGNTGLCLPRSLAEWYASRDDPSDDPLPCIPETADRDVLVTLYNETGGPGWRRSSNWLGDRSLNTWSGIATDAEGYVTEIFLPWNNLTDSIPPELGDLARLEVLALYGNELTGRIPPELGELARVRDLSLSSNKLEGPIPPEIGGMVSVDTMYLSGNDLSGPIPPEFGNLVNLEHLALFENELSGPLPAEFGNLKKLKSMWLVDNKFEGPLPPELGDMTSLEDLSLSRNKITGSIPPELGKLRNLKYLGIPDNELTGPIPPELGNLASLTELFLMRNQLSDSIPPELGKLSNLETIWIFDNQLTGPIPPELGNLSSLKDLSIGTNELTGSIPPELGNLSALEGLLIPRAKLTGTIPPELGNLSNLETLWLFKNQLSGSIPAELGNLSVLEDLTVSDNMLTGPIPPELGRLSSLEALGARYNNLTGTIPAELGQLSSLQYLSLPGNDLSGELPPEIGGLVSLEHFDVDDNHDLTGLMPRSMLNLPLGYLDISDTWICPHLDDEFQEWLDGIPRAYGLWCPPTVTERFALTEFYSAASGDSWTDNSGWDGDSPVSSWYGVTVSAEDTLVRRLVLPSNGLRGSIASAIGNLRKLETLDVANNSLTGGIPVAMTSMHALDTLRVSGNADMDGPLPFLMTEMTELQALQYANTDMCASPSATFQSWIGSLDVADGATCDNPDAVRLSLPVVYLTQSIQRRSADVPLLSGREALLRVFLVGDQARAFFEPEVVATFTREGEEVHRVVMRSIDDRLVTTADEGNLRTSYNAKIPAEHMVTGLELVVVADSAETVPRADGSQTRFPDSGSVALNVIDVPPMELTAVPVLNAAKPDSSILPWTDSIADLGAESPQVGLFRYSFPFSEFSAKSREPYVTSLDLTDENNTWGMILELEPVYRAEKGTGYWYAVADSEDGYVRGIARLNGLVSFGKPWDTELAHEVGHNLDLLHAPCGGALGTEPDFPYPNGSIGVWGYDFRDGSVVSPERRRDIMGYCYELGWLSDYYYEKVIRVRANKDETWTNESLSGAGPEGEMLVLWGGVLNGELRIEPVHSMTTTPKLPAERGAYRIEGIGRGGENEFSLSFTPGEDKYGNKYFFFAVPIEADWEDSLERITLTGPEGEVTVDQNDPRSLTIVSDPATGRIRAILRDWNQALPSALGDTAGLEVVTTRGILEAVRSR